MLRLAPDDVQLLEHVESVGPITAEQAAAALELEPITAAQRMRRLNVRGALRIAAGAAWAPDRYAISERGKEALEAARVQAQLRVE